MTPEEEAVVEEFLLSPITKIEHKMEDRDSGVMSLTFFFENGNVVSISSDCYYNLNLELKK